MSDDKDKDKDKDAKGADKGKKKSPLMLVLLLVVGVVAGVGISKIMMGESAPAAEPPPEPGAIATTEPINVNLADGHFLRIGVGVQLTKKVPEKPEAWLEIEGAKVNDAVIKVFSGKDIAEVRTPEGRAQLVAELEEIVIEATEKQVMKVYLSEYVSQ